ncbi:7741_t:CDS:1 [Paraglomus brasilianum]|uniref:7741_t:CDS:1 n=1 Tax=Paraglomus brasilianum TaxID=144538 RepID=A0A9N9GEJ8_9GLOM|nr:7741_t:CDS:1 [Paraglomus brasilianum]
MNNINNDYVGHYTNVHYQPCYPKDFVDSTNPPTQMPTNLLGQSHTQGFRPFAASFPLFHNVDMTSMNSMEYRNTRNTENYTGNHAQYQDNPSAFYFYPGSVNTQNGQLNTLRSDQVETHTNSSCPLPISFQTLCGRDVLHSDTTGNHVQHFGMTNNTNNTCVSYIFTRIPTSNEYVVTREERTQSIVGRISAAASIGEMLALTRSEKEN